MTRFERQVRIVTGKEDLQISYQKQNNISGKLCLLNREANQVTVLPLFTFKNKTHSLFMHLNLFLIGG